MKIVYQIKNGILAGGFSADDNYELDVNETLIAPVGIEYIWNGQGWSGPKEDTSDKTSNKISDEILDLQKTVGQLMLNSIKKGVN